MENPTLSLEIISPKKLDETLKVLSEGNNQTNHRVALNLFGPQILVRQFDLPRLPLREIKNAITLEATEVFSLLPEEIEIDYQILDSSKDKTTGVFAAIPKKILKDYISLLDEAKLTLVNISANIFLRINCFLRENKIENKNFCIIDFYKNNIINIVVFDNKECKLLREVNYENLNDAEKEIMYSLKYASGRSVNKEFEPVYALGDLSNKESMIANLARDLNTDIKHYKIDTQLNNNSTDLFFNIDLIKNIGLSLSMRRKLLFLTNFVLIICFLFLLALGIKTIRQNILIKNLSASFKASDYNYAKDLQKKLNLLKNAK